MHPELESRIQSILQAAFERTLEQVRDELPQQFAGVEPPTPEPVVSGEFEGPGDRALAKTVKALREGVRRIKEADSLPGVAQTLVNETARYARRAVLFIHDQESILGYRAAGSGVREIQEDLGRLQAPLRAAASFSHVIQTKKAVVTRANAFELAPAVVDLLKLQSHARADLFPIVLRDQVAAILYAELDEEHHDVSIAAIELLVFVAGACAEAVGTRKKQFTKRRLAAASS